MSKLGPPRSASEADAALTAATAVLERIPSLRWAYAFGSAARGESFHDVDVALMLRPGALPGTAFGAVVSDLERATRGDVDVADLASAAIMLRARVVREGRVLVDREPAARRLWEVDVTRRWLDIRPWLAEQDRLLRLRLQERRWSTES